MTSDGVSNSDWVLDKTARFRSTPVYIPLLIIAFCLMPFIAVAKAIPDIYKLWRSQ